VVLPVLRGRVIWFEDIETAIPSLSWYVIPYLSCFSDIGDAAAMSHRMI
jgi:hypothetical protein